MIPKQECLFTSVVFAALATIGLSAANCAPAQAADTETVIASVVPSNDDSLDMGDAYDQLPDSESGDRDPAANDDSPAPQAQYGLALPNVTGYSSTMNHVQRAIARGNSESPYRSASDCVRNARDTLVRATRYASDALGFNNSEEVAATLIPHAPYAKDIGHYLRSHWRTQVSALHRRGMYDWHPLDVQAISRDRNGGIWSNGIILSEGGNYGHASTHVWETHTGTVELDQYSGKAFHARSGLLSLLFSGQLSPGRKPSTLPRLINRVASSIVFQWCNEQWGCPEPAYWLDR